MGPLYIIFFLQHKTGGEMAWVQWTESILIINTVNGWVEYDIHQWGLVHNAIQNLIGSSCNGVGFFVDT